ncbi:MAG TPA: 3-deoxy-manno-octulosonate cytidylyltransferase [Bacteroidota bacterium]|nr:3-deoxy-manno-octulosonate cytidylyltransferase [Bacteroidota bacterium]
MSREVVIGVIPARYASQRLPAKPLLDLEGKPMVQRVYEQAKKSKLLNRVIVATDDARIVSAVKGFGGEAILTPATIQSGSDRVAAVAENIEGDIYINIQGDEPLIPPEMIDEAITLLLNDANVKVGTLAREIATSEELFDPNIVKVVCDRTMNALYFSRSPIPFVRDAKERNEWLQYSTFYKHIGLYAYRNNFLTAYSQLPKSKLEETEKLEQLRILENGYCIKVGVTNYDSISVDTISDAERVKEIIRRQSI